MMEKLIITKPSWLEVFGKDYADLRIALRALRRLLGFGSSSEANTVAKMATDLRKTAEASSGQSFKGSPVSVTAPWQRAWEGGNGRDHDINEALWAAILKPWNPYTIAPVYLGEAQASLAASGRYLCERYGCYDFQWNFPVSNNITEYVYYIR